VRVDSETQSGLPMQFTSISEDWICTPKASKNRLPTHKSEEPFSFQGQFELHNLSQ